MIHDILAYLVIGLACTLVLECWAPARGHHGKEVLCFAYCISILGWPVVFPVCVAMTGWAKWRTRK